MLKFGDKIIYIEGVLVEIREDGSAAIDLKGRLGYLEIPQWMLLHEHPLVVWLEHEFSGTARACGRPRPIP